MSRIEERRKFVRRYCARAKGFVALAVNKGLAAIGLMRARETANDDRAEIVQAVFPETLSNTGRSTPNR